MLSGDLSDEQIASGRAVSTVVDDRLKPSSHKLSDVLDDKLIALGCAVNADRGQTNRLEPLNRQRS